MEQTNIAICAELSNQGYLISRQRKIIIDKLCSIQAIGSVDDFWIMIRGQHRISWATVHKTIKILEEIGYVKRTAAHNRQQHFSLVSPSVCQNTHLI